MSLETVTPAAPSTAAALRGFGLVATGAVLAASAWAASASETGVMFDERLWREEVVARNDEWADEGWYELSVAGDAVQVRAARAPRAEEADAAMYLHLPGTQLTEGLRINHLFAQKSLHPRVGHEYKLALGKTPFAFTVESGSDGTAYVISYAGESHRYLLGLPAAATQVHAVVDLDGDRLPDFLVEVGGETFLLLSSQARPGTNLPSAQLWAAK
jgi:hypothetical protein